MKKMTAWGFLWPNESDCNRRSFKRGGSVINVVVLKYSENEHSLLSLSQRRRTVTMKWSHLRSSRSRGYRKVMADGGICLGQNEMTELVLGLCSIRKKKYHTS